MCGKMPVPRENVLYGCLSPESDQIKNLKVACRRV